VGVHTYAEGTVVDITATPNSGYVFDHWTGDVADANAATTTVTMDANKTVTAYFSETVPGVITLDGAVSSNTADDVSSITINHTTGTGTNRLMLVGVSWNCGTTDRTISSVTFTPDGGSATALAEVITEQTGTQLRYSAIYSLLDPPSGQAGTVTVTFSGSVSNGIVAGVANFAGVDQATPLGPSDGANGNSTAPSVTLSGLNGNEVVFDNVFQGASGESQTLTVGSDQTELWNAWIANTRAAASTEQATGSSVTMSWTAASSSYWAIVAVAINPAPAGTTYDLTMAVDPTEGGTTDPAVGVHTYAEGTVVDITATPNSGYAFDHWTGDVADVNSATTTVTMDGDKTVTAHFTQITYDLTMAVDPAGGGTTDPAVGIHTYAEGTIVDITATPSAGYEFDHWEGDVADPNAASTTVTMDVDKTVTAHFIPESGISGDVNGDDEMDSTDALIVLSCDAGIDTSQFCPMNCGDVNADGLVNSTDALIILSYDAGIDVPFPVGEPGCPSSVTPCAGCSP
jgi:uncharacterized repeat protein (TIGR02543 family)